MNGVLVETIRLKWASLGWAGNLVQWQLSGIFKGQPKTPSNGVKPAITCDQVTLPIEGLVQQPSHIILEPQFVLHISCAGVENGTEFDKMANQWLAQLEPHAVRGSSPQTLLMNLVILTDGNLT